MKRTRLYYGLLLLTAITFYSCSRDDQQTDTAYPEIDLGISGAFPQQCSILERGRTFTFRARFTDNMALGSYSLDIHHNFDHHTHSTEVKVCDEEGVKAPVKPMLFIKDYPIPAGAADYTATAEIAVPVDVDPGDYHFMIRLTDKEGWQTMKGISIKII
ncbi:protein of unknown function [Chitinophaga jiangningensis]|uniref:DUF4625 domain-containing protein n=1 Tax=Chitinophaga jiangningensis TaxID=1419482 RepID=A0A1M7J1Z7_9BACT|nr:DUF4625 domain-containing protein [Chitinophaga jiangningensis]SHM47036.1 protein of unknown function [Chitinophaga jiangningensis]